MPYFLCPACAVRAYSAARESRCPACDVPLRSSHQLHDRVPVAEPLGTGRSARRFGGTLRDALLGARHR